MLQQECFSALRVALYLCDFGSGVGGKGGGAKIKVAQNGVKHILPTTYVVRGEVMFSKVSALCGCVGTLTQVVAGGGILRLGYQVIVLPPPQPYFWTRPDLAGGVERGGGCPDRVQGIHPLPWLGLV